MRLRTRIAGIAAAVVFAATGVGYAGCGDDDNEGAGEEAGQAVDDATDEAGEALDDAGKEVDENVDVGENAEGGSKGD